MEQAQLHDTDTQQHLAPGNLTQYESLFQATEQSDQQGNVTTYSNDYAGCGWPRAIVKQFVEAHPNKSIIGYTSKTYDGDDDNLWTDDEEAVFSTDIFQWNLLEKLSHENAFTMYRDNAQGLMDRAMRWFKDTNLTKNSLFATEQESDDPSSHDVFLKAALDEPIIYGFYTVTGKQAYKITVQNAALQLELRKLVISIKLATLPIVNEMLSEMLYRVMVRGALLDYSSSKEASHSTQKAPVTTKLAPYEKHTALKTSQLNYYRMLFTCKNDANQASLDLLTTAGDLPDILKQFDIHPDFAYFDFAYLKIAAFWLCFARHYTAQRKKLLYQMQQEPRTWSDKVQEEHKTAEQQKKQAQEEQQNKPAAEARQRQADAERQRQAAEETQRQAAEERQREAAEEGKRQAAEERQREAAEERQRQAAEEGQRQAAEERQRQAAEQEQKEAAEKRNKQAAAPDALTKMRNVIRDYADWSLSHLFYELDKYVDPVLNKAIKDFDFGIIKELTEILTKLNNKLHAFEQSKTDFNDAEAKLMRKVRLFISLREDQIVLPFDLHDQLHQLYAQSLETQQDVRILVQPILDTALSSDGLDNFNKAELISKIENTKDICAQRAHSIRTLVQDFESSQMPRLDRLEKKLRAERLYAKDWFSAIHKHIQSQLKQIFAISTDIISEFWDVLQAVLRVVRKSTSTTDLQITLQAMRETLTYTASGFGTN